MLLVRAGPATLAPAVRDRESRAAVDQIAQMTLRKVVGQHSLDEMPAATDKINDVIRHLLDVTTIVRGVEVNPVELKDTSCRTR